MTESACPVCATPHEAGATTCAFCGVSLAEPAPTTHAPPNAQPQAMESTEAEISATVAAETDAPADIEAHADSEPEPAAPAIDETNGIAEIAESDEPAGIEGIEAAPVDATEVEDVGEIEADAPVGVGAFDGEAAETPGNASIPADPATQPLRTRAPSFARPPTSAEVARRRLHRIEWSVVAGLAALLLVQVVASDFDQLAAGPATRPWLQRACSTLHCTLPAWREPQALRMLQRDVRASPGRPGLLRISASFRNEARWAQPWPRLRIILSDADGRAIAARDFAANEYLGANATANGIASGQVAGIAFDVVDPSPRVTAFTFEFR